MACLLNLFIGFMLYITPTPVGNLEDITLRAVRLFKEAKAIINEDYRQNRKLLDLIEIENKPQFFDITRNQNLNLSGIKKALEIAHEDTVLLVSDAGTPVISDPGRMVIEMAIESKVQYTTLPGATALIPSIVNSNIIQKEFHFMGFLPIKKGVI